MEKVSCRRRTNNNKVIEEREAVYSTADLLYPEAIQFCESKDKVRVANFALFQLSLGEICPWAELAELEIGRGEWAESLSEKA